MKIERILIAAGGTGGHIYPAVAVADELRKINEDVKILFVGAKGKMEEKIIPSCGYRLITIEISGFERKLNLKNLFNTGKLVKALKISKKIIKDFNPQVVFGTGGYVSGPVLWAASKLGIPTAVHEGNFYPGATVRLLASKVDKLILNFEETKKYFKKDNNILLMNCPVRKNLNRLSKREAAAAFGLDHNKKILFVVGGSLGAGSINEAVSGFAGMLCEREIQLIWQTGQNDYNLYSEKFLGNNSIKILKYIDNMDAAYSACNLIVCRAGISTIMEVAAFGCAAIFVPYPKAAENHQEKNARAMVKAGAAEMILDNDLKRDLMNFILRLMDNDQITARLKEKVKSFADPDAAYKLAELLDYMSKYSVN
jgi:UDP-N-acetylglucosamine--N-acetylmuramyl-(pentapeptide) pyrophosphoryl-undecaprenol N-acetylglucosamine transferase